MSVDIGVEDTLKRIQGHENVVGLIVMDNFGRVIRSTMDDDTTMHSSAILKNFCELSKNTVKELDPVNDLTFIRLRTRKNEILIAPDKDYLMAVFYKKA